jgi:hypothetical protein
MSNRSKWAHWNNPKPEKHPFLMKWIVGITFIVLGSLFILSGGQGLQERVYWYQSFSFHLGRPVVRQTVGLIFLGAGFLVAGTTILVARK